MDSNTQIGTEPKSRKTEPKPTEQIVLRFSVILGTRDSPS